MEEQDKNLRSCLTVLEIEKWSIVIIQRIIRMSILTIVIVITNPADVLSSLPSAV